MRKAPLITGEFYHIFNRGVDKRVIFADNDDFERFLLSMRDFNAVEPIGSIFENSFRKRQPLGNLVSKWDEGGGEEVEPLVESLAYCLNPNHFHLVLKQVADRGIEKFMHRLGLGYTKYFNEKNNRGGALFQGTFKSVHVESDEQLLYLVSYVNLNNRVHNISDKKCRSSWGEYVATENKGICSTSHTLSSFKNRKIYVKEAEAAVENCYERREEMKELFLEELGN